jgi:hypothetical protein
LNRIAGEKPNAIGYADSITQEHIIANSTAKELQ